MYQTCACRMCKKNQVTTFCVCRPAYWLCKDCYSPHVFEEHSNANPTKRGITINETGNHKLMIAPPGARAYNPTTGWNTINKDKRQKYLCTSCNKRRIRTVCVCDKTKWTCLQCHVHHVGDVVFEIANKDKSGSRPARAISQECLTCE